jgi:hypothetical protein
MKPSIEMPRIILMQLGIALLPALLIAVIQSKSDEQRAQATRIVEEKPQLTSYLGPYFSFAYPKGFTIQENTLIDEHYLVQGFDHYGFQSLHLASTGVFVTVVRRPYAPGQSAMSQEQLIRREFADNQSGSAQDDRLSVIAIDGVRAIEAYHRAYERIDKFRLGSAEITILDDGPYYYTIQLHWRDAADNDLAGSVQQGFKVIKESFKVTGDSEKTTGVESLQSQHVRFSDRQARTAHFSSQ